MTHLIAVSNNVMIFVELPLTMARPQNLEKHSGGLEHREISKALRLEFEG